MRIGDKVRLIGTREFISGVLVSRVLKIAAHHIYLTTENNWVFKSELIVLNGQEETRKFVRGGYARKKDGSTLVDPQKELQRKLVVARAYGAGPKTLTKIKEEYIMSQPKLIETKTFIRGELSTDVSDDEIFSHIAQVEGEIEKLDKVRSQPMALRKKIETMHSEIVELAKFVDERDGIK